MAAIADNAYIPLKINSLKNTNTFFMKLFLSGLVHPNIRIPMLEDANIS